MRINIYAKGFSLSHALRQFASDRVGHALSRIAGIVRRVQLHLVDVNGPNRCGNDKLCRLVVQIARQKTIVLEDQDCSPGLVINRITDRLGEVANRRVNRRRTRRRSIGGDSSLYEA